MAFAGREEVEAEKETPFHANLVLRVLALLKMRSMTTGRLRQEISGRLPEDYGKITARLRGETARLLMTDKKPTNTGESSKRRI